MERQGEEAARAPKFPSDEKLLEELRETHPEVAKELTRKDDVLHQRLRQVVTPLQNTFFFLNMIVSRPSYFSRCT